MPKLLFLCYNPLMINLIPKMKANEYSITTWAHATNKHLHSDWEFTTLLGGKAVDIVNDVEYPQHYGSIILLGPQHIHQQLEKEPITRLDFCISDELFREDCEYLRPGLYEELYAIKTPIILSLNIHIYQDFMERLSALQNMSFSKNNNGKQIAHSLIFYLLGLYLEKQDSNSKSTNNQLSEFIHKLHTYEFFQKSIEEIIDETNYSHSQFLVLFKQHTGKTLISYLTELRMSYAEKLLTHTNMPILNIANTVGYTTQSFFTQTFKKFYKCTPSEHRKRKK